jgi:membrane-bound lytic murein transglycosylase D
MRPHGTRIVRKIAATRLTALGGGPTMTIDASKGRLVNRISRLLAFVLLAAAVVGCARRAVPPSPTAPPVAEEASPSVPAVAEPPRFDEARVRGLYDRLADGLFVYRRGVELLAAGDEVAGEERISRASRTLRDAMAECAATAGCELDRFLDGVDTLMNEQNLALKQQSYRIATLEAEREPEIEQEQGTSPVIAVLPEVGETVSVLRGTDLRDLIEVNGPVNAAMNDWLTWMRPHLMESWENYQYLRPRVAPIYEEAGLPEALLFAMIATESGGKAHAVSRAGAAGVLQFMSYTGRKYGLGKDGDFDLRFDPAESTRANVAYLDEQFRQLNDDLPKVLAAYNGGEGRMAGLERRYPGASLWDARVYWSLPRETRDYVPRILAAAWLFLHPEDYGLEFPSIDPAVSEVSLVRDASLGELAICLGQANGAERGWFRTLRNLNPRIEPSDRIPAGTEIVLPAALADAYAERCEDGPLVDVARDLHDADYPEEPEMIVYTVRRGDTLGRIASKFRCTDLRQLAAINGIRAPRYVIRPGQELKIPPCN